MDRLFKLFEAASTEERLNARVRKRRQRDREDATQQSNPYAYILVVRNKMNDEILIIDKESYTPKYHEIILPPERLNQAVLKDIIDQPKFVQTETSKRLFGNVKGETKVSSETGADSSQGQASGGTDQQAGQAPVPQAPAQQVPFSEKNYISGPVIALGMMNGMQSKDLLKLQISEEELAEFNSSQEIQQVSIKIAKEMAFYFKHMFGREITEYTPYVVKNQMFETTNMWKLAGGYDSTPKSDIVFKHKCIDESKTNKKCEQSMCACLEAGIVPSEYIIPLTLKYGTSPVLYGKLNGNTEATAYSAITLMDLIANDSAPENITFELNEKEKDAVKKYQSDIKFIKNITKDYFVNKINLIPQYDIKEKYTNIDKFISEIAEKFERILNSNILFKHLVLLESMNGFLKFGSDSPAFSKAMIGINEDNYDVAMDEIDLDIVRKITLNDFKFTINVKSNIDVSKDEASEMESCKIRFGGECPKLFTPDKFIIRQLLNSYTEKTEAFSYSNLKYLVNENENSLSEADFIQIVENANGLVDLMTIFAIVPHEMTIQKIDFYSLCSTIFSAEKNIVRINGKIFTIPVQMDPVEITDKEQITENTGKVRAILENLINLHVKPKSTKRRDYKKEYKKFQASRKAKLARAARVRNRRLLMRKHLVRKGDKVDIDHIDGNPMHNYSWNLHKLPRSVNRAKH